MFVRNRANCWLGRLTNCWLGRFADREAVPLRLEHNRIGEAAVLAARTRPKFIGGSRAAYNDELL